MPLMVHQNTGRQRCAPDNTQRVGAWRGQQEAAGAEGELLWAVWGREGIH